VAKVTVEERLRTYFEREPSVVMAFLFGSRVKGIERMGSDCDIGIYFKPQEYMETETDIEYPEELRIWSDLIDILHTDNVDIVVLNRAGQAIVYDILRKGLPLVIKDRNLYMDLLLKTSYEAMDWWDFVKDYYEISEKSRSISPSEKARLLRTLENEFGELKDMQSITYEDYLHNSFKRKVIERWIENIVMAMLDIAKIIMASSKREIPETYKEILKTFGTVYINESFGEKIAWFAIMRNIVTHEYLDIRWKRIKKFITDAETFVPIFIKGVNEVLTVMSSPD
jgi:uncharacterized protein YutE (UPF0331/DUF86 family)/predicted nucleotidyltransferase